MSIPQSLRNTTVFAIAKLPPNLHQAWHRRSDERLEGGGQETLTVNCTIKDATVKRFHYETNGQQRTHLADFLADYNFARRLKTLSGITPYEYICKIWTSEPDRFFLNPIHEMPGLNT